MFVTGESVFVQPRVGLMLHSPESQKESFDNFKKVMQVSIPMSTFTLFIAATQYHLRLKGNSFSPLPTYCTSLLSIKDNTDHLTPDHIEGNLLGRRAKRKLTGAPGGLPLLSVLPGGVI